MGNPIVKTGNKNPSKRPFLNPPPIQFRTHVGFIKAYPTNKKHPQKGRGYSHVTRLIF